MFVPNGAMTFVETKKVANYMVLLQITGTKKVHNTPICRNRDHEDSAETAAVVHEHALTSRTTCHLVRFATFVILL